MALSLSKKLSLVLVFSCICLSVVSQELEHDATEYKDPKQFEKFRKRKSTIAAWQINQLKKGALIVRLKTNQKVIDAFKKDGNLEMAAQKERDQYAINKNTMLAYMDYFKFCKVYFIYSNSSDTLLNGSRSGIFLDTTMTVNPGIVMAENFYMIAERDYAYNTSIGFVPEDSARYAVERGSPIKQMAVVVKNKFGNQAKGPFPYCVKEKSSGNASYDLPAAVVTKDGKTTIYYSVNKTYLKDLKDPVKKAQAGKIKQGQVVVKVPVELTYEHIAPAIDELSMSLGKFYQANPSPDMDRTDPEIRQFLY